MAAPTLSAPPRPLRPWDRPHPEFTYSESQDRRRRTCARAHIHAVHTAHRGWSAQPGSASWLAYRLKQAQPLAAALGIAVHDAANACVKALVAGLPLPTFAELRARAAGALNERWRNGRDRRQTFWRRPREAPLFLDALYQNGPTPFALTRARAKLDAVLDNLLSCGELWSWVRAAAPRDVVLVDSFYRFTLPDDVLPDGLPVYAAPDLLVRPSRADPWHIIDFKSGGADGVADQVHTYALAAERGLRLDLTETGATGVVVALNAPPEQRVATFEITRDDVADAEARIRAGVAEARALLVDPAANAPRALEEVPGPRDPSTCRWCAFRALCHPGAFPLSADATARLSA
jgi:hypothetical protein